MAEVSDAHRSSQCACAGLEEYLSLSPQPHSNKRQGKFTASSGVGGQVYKLVNNGDLSSTPEKTKQKEV